MDRTTWSAAEAADKLLSAVQTLLPTSPEHGPRPHRNTIRNVAHCVSEMLADAGLYDSSEGARDGLQSNRAQIAETLRALLAALEDESEVADAAAADILTELHDRLTVLQGG